MVGAPGESEILRWIPALPLIGALVHGLLLTLVRRPMSRLLVVLLSCGVVVAAFCASLLAVVELLRLPPESRLLVDELYTWIGSGRFSAELAFQLDPLSALMCLVVTGVGSLIHVYSIGYMDDDHRDDKGFQRFFCYLNLFTFSMLMLVLGENLLLLFLGWEGVGLCSYLLIGFWYSDRWNAYCGSKAFIVNRIGDFGFLVGMLMLFWALADAGSPTLSFRGIEAAFASIAEKTIATPWGEAKLVTLAALCLFVGACGKSAQLPLYVWLPDAMAGPTPVSALIHAATMVTAGVYMVCRMSFLFDAAPTAAAVVAWTGALTALFAATIAVAQTDIKKVLAYSTVSQLGYMFLAAGSGGYVAAMFHLTTHAFFKALLFLAAGAVILAMHHEQDTDRMGGLRTRIPTTWAVFGIGVLSIMGFPGLSGFFSKDEVLIAAWSGHVPGHRWLFAIGLFTAALTSFYMFRVFFRTFHGECRAPREVQQHIHEPASTVMFPLYLLAALSVVGGYIGLPQMYGDMIDLPHSNSLAQFLAPVVGEPEHALDYDTEARLAFSAVVAGALGFALAWLFYLARPAWPGRVRAAVPALWRLVRDKYYVDEAIDAVLVRPLVAVSDRVLYRGIDAGLIDGAGVNGTAAAVHGTAMHVLRRIQSGLAQSYLALMLAGAAAVVAWMAG